ncbi:MAG: ArgE/DapE family deacylase [bacterium]
MRISIDKNFIRKTLIDLVTIDSVNPSLVSSAPGENEIAAFIAAELKKLGLQVRTLSTEPGRDSAVGIFKGSGGGKSLMLNAHLDTVGVDGMLDPFSAEIRDGKLYGRGAYDMKGAMAACMAAAKALVDAKVSLKGDLVIAGVADEEFTSIGTSDVIRHYKVDAAIVTEPTQLRICLAHKGFVWLEVETEGRAAHGSRFQQGIDANMRMGRFLAELDKHEQAIRHSTPHPLVGPPTLHAATLQGGTGLSTYSAHCKLEIERRTIPGETEADVIRPLQNIIDRLSEADSTFRASIKTTCVRDAFEIPREAEIVKTLAKTTAEVLGAEPNYFGDTPWMDSALLANAGIETVVMGPSGAGAHAAEEWVDLASVEKLAEILARTVIEYCGV